MARKLGPNQIKCPSCNKTLTLASDEGRVIFLREENDRLTRSVDLRDKEILRLNSVNQTLADEISELLKKTQNLARATGCLERGLVNSSQTIIDLLQ